MSGILLSAMNNLPQSGSVVTPNTWTGTTSNLQINYLNAPATGSTWTDASGNGRNGTVYTAGTGAATYTTNKNGGLNLGPTSTTNMAMVANTSYNLTVPFSVEVIADINAPNYWATLWGNENYNSGIGWFAYWQGSTNLSIGNSTRYNTYSVAAQGAGIRQFIVTADYLTATLKLYINGTLQSPTTAGYTTIPSQSASGMNFGSRHPNAGTTGTPYDCAPGTYYQMRVYNAELTQTQVTNNYNAVKTTYGI